MAPGDYILDLETFDLNSGVYSTLRTDQIKIVVTAKVSTLAIFTERIEPVTILEGTA